MEHHTHLSKLDIESILGKFGIHSVSSFEILSGGYENTNYLVKSESGNFVVCINEQKSAEKVKDLIHLLKHLEENSFNSSKVIRTIKNDTILDWNEKSIIVKNYIDGKPKKDLSPGLLKLIGKEIAKLHKIAPPAHIQNQLNYGKETFVNVKKYAAGSAFDIWLEQVINLIRPYLKLNLPKAFIHSDIFWDNVIIPENESSITIIDFEESTNYYRVFDIGMAIIGTCAIRDTINLIKAKHLLEGYQSEIKLSDVEINSLKAFTIYAGASMTFWRHQNFNYIKPDPKMFNHYLGLKVLVDYIAQLTNDYFLEQLNLVSHNN